MKDSSRKDEDTQKNSQEDTPTSEKEKSSLSPGRESYDKLLEGLAEEFRKSGTDCRIESPKENEFTVILNPPRSLVEKLKGAKKKPK